MKKSSANIFLSLFLVLASAACKQNPYPNQGELKKDPTEGRRPVEPAHPISVNDVIEFKEGRYLEYKIRADVEAPGVPLVTIDNLPAGATFDKETFILKWRPSFSDGNDPTDPSVNLRLYPITVWLRSSIIQEKAWKKTVNLKVQDTPRPIEITLGPEHEVNEGQKFSNTITIVSPDYPQGPFQVGTSTMPANTELVKVSENTFRLEFIPDYFHVKRNINGPTKSYLGKIVAINPSGNRNETELAILVKDKRLKASLIAPDKLVQGLDVNFQVVGYDLNKEISPQVTMVSEQPKFGHFEFKEIENNESSSTVLNVSWTDIPPIYNGREFTLKFRACVLGETSSYNNCKESFTTIKIEVKDRKPPQVARQDWPTGEMLYLGYEQKLVKKIEVTSGENTSSLQKVEIFPIEVRKYVSWEKNQLTMQFSTPGVFQFNLKATSEFNVSSSESFLVEVFPKERNNTLFFADSTRDPEALFYKSTLKNIDIMNPAIQDIALRDIANRETLVIGTSTLMDPEVGPKILKAIDRIKNIFIASPLINNLPEKFLEKMRTEYDLVTIGRYSQLPNLPPLDKMQFVKTGQFQEAKGPVTLKQNTSSESHDPVLFNGGLYDPQKICKGILGISPDKNNPYVIGVVCNRSNGGRIALLGTEWADLRVSAGDEQIPVQWFITMMKGKF